MSESSNEIYRLSEGVLSAPVGSETVVLTMGSEKYFGVRVAMQHLLEALRDGLSLDEMITRTCERYQVEPEVARSDLEAMLAKLIAAGIVERNA